MAAANYTNTVQKIYIAFYQRPADPSGLEYWAGRLDAAKGSLVEIINAFATSPEAQTLYGSISAANIGTVIDSIYMALFNRPADAEGKAFYVNGFTSGKFTAGTITLDILNGARNEDATAIANKLVVANKFTTALEDAGGQLAYNEASVEFVRDMLASVTAETNASKFGVGAIVDQVISGDFGKTITLTEAVNAEGGLTPIMLTPGESNLGGGRPSYGDDKIVAGRLELLHQAYIDGGDGYNILEVDAKGVYAQPAELINIQEVRIENLPNVYTGTGNGGYLSNSSYPNLADTRAASSEVISASHFNKVAVTANQLVVMVNGQPKAVSAGVYTADSLAAAINALAGSAVAVVNEGAVSVSGTEVSFRGDAVTQIQSGVFNSALINDLQIQVVTSATQESGKISIPAGLYTASELKNAIDAAVPGADIVTVDTMDAAVEQALASVQEARENAAAARWVLDAAQARADLDDASDAYDTAVATEQTATTTAASAANASASATAALTSANAAVTAATNATIAAAAVTAATVDRDATAVRVTTANNAAAANTGAAQTRSADASARAEDAREALDAVVTAIAALQNNTPAETQLLLTADQTVNGAQLAANAASAALATQVGVLNTALGNPASTAVQVSAAQAAVASAQGVLAQANADLVAALQQRTDIALQIANGETKPDAAYLNLQALQNDYAQAQGEAAEARNALNVALAEQAAIAATGVRENTAATAAFEAASGASTTAATAAIAAYNAANPGTDTDLAMGTGAAAILAAAQALATSAQALAITTGSALTTAQTALAAARQEVIDAFAALENAQETASAANAAAARELVRADADVTDLQVTAALELTVTAAQQALSAALADLLAAEGALSNLDPAGLVGRSGSVVISTNGSNAPELRFYGAQALEFGLSDIAFDGTLTIPARNGLSVIDLTRAMDIEKLVITEGSGTEAVIAGQLPLGALTIVGVRNGAALRLEGGFTQDVNVSYGAGRADGTPLTLELVSGDWAEGATLNLLQNTDSLRIMSLGGGANSLNAGNLGGELVDLYVGGNASLRLVGDLNSSFANDYAKIDAGANLGGVSLTLSGTERVEIIGSAGNDVFIINTPEGADSIMGGAGRDSILGAGRDDFVSITGGKGNNQYDIDSARVEITNAAGNNLYVIKATESNTITSGDGRNTYKVDANLFSKITAGNGNQQATVTVADGASEITVGSGNHLITVTTNDDAGSTTGAGHNTVTAGAGNGRFIVTANGTGNAVVTTGAGNSNFDVSAATGNATVSTGNGNSRFDVDTVNGNATVTAGNGDGIFDVQAGTNASNGGGNVVVVAGNGNSTFDLDAFNTDTSGVSVGGSASLTAGDGNLRVDVQSERGSIVTVGTGNSAFNINSVGLSSLTAVDGRATVTMNVAGTPVSDGEATVNLGNGDKNVTVNADVIRVTTGATGNNVFNLSNEGIVDGAKDDLDLAKEIVLSTGNGNNIGDVDAQKVTITAGNGANQLNVDGIVVSATLGNGNNLVQMRTVNATTTLGDGNNTVNLRAYDSPQSFWTFQDQFDTAIKVTAGNGANTINMFVDDLGLFDAGGNRSFLKPASINIVAGNGGNTINIPDLPTEGSSLPGSALTTISVTTGTGNDKILVGGSDITIKSGGGRDVITIVGTDGDYTTDSNGAKLDINTGTGAATINLGAATDPNFLLSGTIVAKQGSVITGSDITLFVNTVADLRAASLTGITRVILDDDNTGYNGGAADGADSPVANNAVLTLTDRQFLAIGAANFSVDGAVFNTHAIVRIVVTQSTSLTALGVDGLPSNVDLQLEIKDGVTLTMTAQQLHERVMAGGVFLGDKDINDKAAGKVIIDGAGSYTDPATGVRVDFDPFNSSDVQNATYDGQKYIGGSLSSDFLKPNPGTPPYTLSDWFNVTVPTKFNGYVRPIDVTARQYVLVDTTNASERTLTSDQITTIGDLFIIGTGDFTMAKDVEVDMGPNFLVDFSALEGEVNNFTLANFQEVGQVRGNSLEGYEAVVNVMLTAAATGEAGVVVGAAGTGLKISGVTKLVVVDIADSDATVTDVENATINFGSATHDLETVALRGNYNSTLTLTGVSEGTVIELQGDGFASRAVTPLAAGPAATSNVGKINVTYDVDLAERGVEATVLLNNQGVATTRDLRAFGITINNVDTVKVVVEDGNAVINTLAGADIDALVFSSSNSVTISPTAVLTVGAADTAAGDVTGINRIDASDVTGTFAVSLAADGATQNLDFAAAEGATTVTLTTAFTFDATSVFSDATTTGALTIVTGGNTDFQKANIAGVDAIKLATGNNVTLTWAQLDTLGEANITRAGATGTGTVTVIDWNGGAIDTSVLGTGITATLVLDNGSFTLDPAANLSKVNSIVFADDFQAVAPNNEASALTMTGAQFVQLVQSLVNSGGTTALANFLASGRDQLNITGLTQAQADTVFKTPDGTTVATFSQVLASISNKLGADAGTITLAESVKLSDSAYALGSDTETGNLTFSFVLGTGMTLGLATEAQADGLKVTKAVGATGTGIQLNYGSSATTAGINAANFDVDTLRVRNTLVDDQNAGVLFNDLKSTVQVVVYNGFTNATIIDRVITVEPGLTVPGYVMINDMQTDTTAAGPYNEIRTLTLNLSGGVEIEGALLLSTMLKEGTATDPDVMQTYLRSVTINSTPATGGTTNQASGGTGNVITGAITPMKDATGVLTDVDNNLKSVVINATEALTIVGGIVFSQVSETDVPDGIAGNNITNAVATLTVNGTANVNIGALSTADDDVDGLTVVNAGSGTLTLTLDGAQLDQTAAVVAAGADSVMGTADDVVTTPRNIDALSFTSTGTGRIVLNISGNVNLSDDVITGVSSIVLANGAQVTLSLDQVRALGEANVKLASGAFAAGLVVNSIGTQPFDSTAVPDGIAITAVMAAGNIVLDAATNLRDVTTLTVNNGTTLTMTATQATQLVNEALTTGTAPNQAFTPITFNTTTATGGTINVTGIGQSHLDAGLAAVLQGMGGSNYAAPGTPFLRGTIEIVEDVKLNASTLNAAAVSGFSIVGNGAPGLRVDVTMDTANAGTDPSAIITDALLGLANVADADANVIGLNPATGVKSTGISTYVVTALSAQTDVFYVCNDTVGLTTLGLQGNAGDTIYFGGVKRGVTFLLEGDGKASWSDVEKIDLTPDVTEIGGLTAAFFTANNPSATVVINNQGTTLGASSTGGERAITTGAITINNALAINLQVQDGDAVVASVAGNQATTLNITAVEDLFITAALPNLETINATGVAGLFKATISDNDFDLVTGPNADITITGSVLASTASIDGSAGTLNLNIGTTSDLSAGTLISVETLKIVSGQSVTLSAAQVAAIGEADISGVAGGSSETLNINGLTGAITINEALLGTGVVLGTVTMAAGTHTLTAGTDLTGASLLVPAGSTLTLTADQYMALADLDGIAPVAPATAQAVIRITGLTQAHIDAGFTLANVSNVNVALSDVALDPAAATVNLDAATNLNGFGVDLSANQTLGLATSVQADGLRIAGDSTNTVVFRFDALDALTADGRIDASKYSVGTLRAMDAFFTDPSALNGEENAEFVIQGLSGDVTLVVYTDPTLLGITGYNRSVIIEAGVTVPAEFVFNDTGSTRELIDLTITLQGGAEINGDLRLPTTHQNGSGARFFDDLVINSTGAATAAGNVIDGDITPLPETAGAQNPTTTTERENNLLKVTIAGDKALAINGDIVFNKVGDNDAATTNNNGAATLTVTSTAAVTVGALDTSDNDVTSLTVSNTGGATLSLTIDAAKIDAADALSFTGGNIVVTVTGNVDLSDDIITGVSAIKVVETGALELSFAQLQTLGAGNVTVIDGTDGGAAIGNASLTINGYAGEAFNATTLDANFTTVSIELVDADVTLAAGVNLTNVDQIVVQEGRTLTLTAAQFQQLQGNGSIVGFDTNGNSSIAPINVVITDLTQAQVDAVGGFNLSGVNVSGGSITVSLGQQAVDLGTFDTNGALVAGSAAVLNGARFELADDQTLGLVNYAQANGLDVNGGDNTTLVYKWSGALLTFPTQIDASGYNVTTLKALAASFTTVPVSNIEYSIDDLPSTVTVYLYADPQRDLGFLDPTFRKVVIGAGVTTQLGLSFNDWDADDEVRTLDLTLSGGSEINGDLRIPTRNNKDAQEGATRYFDAMTIRSVGTQANTIDGSISTSTGGSPTPNTAENNLLKITITGDAALNVNGDIVFNKVGDNSAATTADNAVATLTVNSSAAVTMGAVNTADDDVTGLTVNNTGTGTLSLTVDAAKIDAADALTFTGDNIALTVNGAVDLSNDNLAGVNSIVISDSSTLTVTQAQFDALGAANFGTDGSPVAVNIVITEFGAAPFDATDLAAGINVQSLVLAASPAVITLDPATNLTDVDQIVVPAGSTLRLTAAQFQQLQGEGTIVSTGPSTAFSVEIYDVRQANVAVDTDNDGMVDAGDQVLNLGSIGNGAAVTLQLASDATTVTFGSFTSTGVSAPAFASDLFVGTSANLASIQMGNSQSVVFVSAAQADGIRVTGGTSSNVVFAFDDTLVLEATTGPNSQPGNGIDASLYNVTNLRALNVFVDGRNVEQVVENLPGAVNLVVYENPEDVAVGFRSAVNRTVIIEPNVSIDDFVAFIDLNTSREIRNLTIEMQGGTEIDGNVRLATMPTASATTQPRYFDTLTIDSKGATANLIDGDITAQPSAATPSQVGSVENNLLKVVVSGTQNLVITGDIVFSKVGNGAVGGGDDAVANLTITNTGTTTISQLDVSDNDLSGLTIVNNGGLLTVTGASPAVNDVNAAVLGGAGENLETLTLSGTGDITFGLNPNVVTETGVDLGNVSNVNASALSGNLNLGEVTNIDNANFSFTSGTGVTTLTLTSDTLLETALTDLGWNFNFANAAVGSEFHLGSAAGSSLDFDNGGAGKAGSLTINLGNNTTLYIDENTNLTDLDLSILQSPTAPAIVLADGVTLTLTAAQASGLRIVAGPDTGTVGITAKVQIVDLGNTAVDLSGIAANIAGTTLLEDNDVTLDAATNLGAFSVTLNSLVDSGSMDLSGQTIRFATQVQADGRTILVTGDADNSAGVNSTNVVWLFNSVTGPLDTGDYSGQIGRLWMTQALLSGANVEQLFTTLPNTIVRSEFTTLTQLDGFLSPSQPVDRIVELVAFTNLPNGMVFNDEDALEGIQSLTLNLGGQVSTGNISIDDAVALGTDPTTVLFNELTINSYRALHQDHVLAPEAYVNDNDGTNEVGEFVQPQNINTVGNIRVVGVANSGIDLLTVNLDTKQVSQVLNVPVTGLNQNAGANLVVGTITFDSAAKTTPVFAELNVAGANTTTVASLDASDADIDVMVITNGGSGALTITGASPAVGLGTSAAVSNVEELAINATGNITLGTQGDADKPGVVGDDLSRIEVSGPGIVNLGVIALVDGSSVNIETPSFWLNGSNKATTFAVFGEANVGGVPTAPVLQATGSWLFQDATITFTDDVVLGAGVVRFDNVALTISGNVNFTTLAELIVDNTDVTIEVPAGSSLTILAEDADGLTITGDGSVTVLGLEDAVDADLSRIMTSTGDTGTLSVIVDTADGADVDALPDTVVLDTDANLGKAQVSVIGGGTLDVTNVPVNNLQATWNHDGLGSTANITVKATFNVAAATTLVVTAAQGDERTVTGAGTTNVENIALFAGANDLSLAGVATAVVNIAVDSNVTLNSADNLGAAGPGRVTTIAAAVTLTAASSVVSGQYIEGEDATLLVDDENTAPVETPITANLSNVSAEFITLVDTAIAGAITFPVLYGSPAAQDLDRAVAVQTVTLTAAQASGQTINGAGAGTQGEVIVNALGAGFTNLSLIDVGRATANVPADATLHAGTNLGEFDVVLAQWVDLTLSAAQADGRSITGVDGDAVVTALEATPNADLSGIVLETEVALLDANGGVTLGANLGSDMEVIVSDSVGGGSNTVTFTGEMVSAETEFTIASDAITLVFDANDAHELTVAEAAGGVANSAVIVNNVDGDLMDLTGITADTLTANVPADTVMNAASNFGGFNVVLAEGADLTLSFAQFLNVGVNDAALDAVDFSSAAGGVEEIVTVTGWIPATALDTSVVPSTLALKLVIAEGSAASQTVNAATNLSGVEEIVIPAGVTLTMTADQFQQIQHSVTVTGAGTLNLTMFDNDNADIDLSSVTANAGTISLDPAAGATTVTAGQVTGTPVIVDPTAILDNAAGAKFGIVMTAANQGITLSSESQADGRSVTEQGALANTRLILGFQSPDAQDGNVNLEASGYGTDEVYVLNTYLFNQFGGVTPANIESFLNDLDPAIPVIVFDADAALVDNIVSPTVVTGYTRTFVVEPNTLVNASVLFNDLDADSNVQNVIVNLRGNAYINGNLSLPQNEDPRGQLPTKYVQLFNTLTINSTDEVGTLVSPNVLNGNIFANNVLNGAESQVEVFTLTLDPGMAITGSEDQIGFDGAVVNLGDGWTVDQVGAALALAQYTNWGASYDAVTNVVTFTNITAGAMTDATIGSFTFQANSTSANFPGTSAVAVTQQGVFQGNENNLLNVVINAEHDLTITGTLEFRYVSGTDSIVYNDNDVTAEANLNIDVDASVTVNIGSVNTGDDHITALNFTKTGTGTVNVPGTSPGASVGDTETLNITQVNGGVITFGTAGDLAKPGVAGDDLSLIDVNGGGTINLGVIAQVDGNAFELNTDGMQALSVVTATLRADMAAGGTWTFDNSSGGGALNLTIAGTGVADAYGVNAVYGTTLGAGTLVLRNVDVTITGTVDFTTLTTLTLDNSSIVVPAGATLVLTVDQVEALAVASMAITGEGTVEVIGNADNVPGATLGQVLKTVNVDLSGVTLTAADEAPGAGDEVLQFQNAGAADDAGLAPVAQNLIGSDNDDLFLLSDNNDTVTGGLGNDTYTGGTGYYTYNVDAGTDTITELFSHVVDADVLVVSAGATANATVSFDFVATADSSNAGTVVLTDGEDDGDTTIDFSLAGGTGSYTITGGSGAVAGTDVLAGGEGADVINGGNTTQTAAAAKDVLTGNGGADQFVFNVNMGNTTALVQSSTTGNVTNADREQIQITAGATATSTLVFSYTINGNPVNVNVNVTAGMTPAQVAQTIANQLQIAGTFVSAASTSGTDTITVTAQPNFDIELTGITAGTTGVVAAAAVEGTDVAQQYNLTAAGTPTAGDQYSVAVTLNGGGTILGLYTASVTDDADDVLAGLAADFNANAVSVSSPVLAVDTLTDDGSLLFIDQSADNGGFSLVPDLTAAFGGSGASNGAADFATADIVTDFATGVDKIVFATANATDLQAGSGTNYVEAGPTVNFGTALSQANTAFGDALTEVQYYFTSVADIDGAGDLNGDLNTATDLYGVLFFDANLDGTADGVILLTGITSTSFAATDIIAS